MSARVAERRGSTVPAYGRYENNKFNLFAPVLKRLAEAFDAPADYLMSGGTDVAAAQLIDRAQLDQFRAVERLDDDDEKPRRKLY